MERYKVRQFVCEICGTTFSGQGVRITCSRKCLHEYKVREIIDIYSRKAGEPIEQWLRRRYLDDSWSYRQICDALGVKHVHGVMKLMKHFGIQPRTGAAAIHAQWIHRGKMTEEERKQHEYEKVKRNRARWPNKARARWSIGNAVSRGEMPRPSDCACSQCGAPAAHYHHHKGYDNEFWLDVIPVCAKCHYHLDKP